MFCVDDTRLDDLAGLIAVDVPPWSIDRGYCTALVDTAASSSSASASLLTVDTPLGWLYFAVLIS